MPNTKGSKRGIHRTRLIRENPNFRWCLCSLLMYFVTQPFVYTVMGSLKIFKQCLSTGGGPRMKVKGEDSQTGIKLSQV